MTNTRAIAAGLVVVATCAVILSFSGLYDLARACGFGEWLAALVPVLADAGAAVASAVWLGGAAGDRARRFARIEALSLMAASVFGNAAAHALAAYQVKPHWLVVVLVGALAPAVLAATLHLRSLVNGGGEELVDELVDAGAELVEQAEPGLSSAYLETELEAAPAAPAELAPVAGDELADAGDDGEDVIEKARKLAAEGAGRPALKKLGLKEHQARQLITEVRQGGTTNGRHVLEEAK